MEKTNKNLVKALCELNKCEPENLQEFIRRNYHKNYDFIKGIIIFTKNFIKLLFLENVLITKHLKKNIVIKPDFITNRSAVNLFSHRGYKKITVDQYYFIKHKIDLSCPNLPCLAIKGGGDHKYYYPMEVIEIIDIENLKLN